MEKAMTRSKRKARLILPVHEWLSMEPMGSLYTAASPFVRWLFLSRLKMVLADIECGSDSILDLGTGNGVLIPSLSEAAARVIGMDNDEDNGSLKQVTAMLAKHGYADKNIQMIWGDAQSLPFPTGVLDYVLCVSILDHLENMPQALSEIRRVLKPSGRLIVGIIPDKWLLHAMRPLYQKTINRIMGWEGDIFAKHVNSFEDIYYQVQLQFKVIRIRRLTGFIPWRISPYVAMVCASREQQIG